jgi:hypothetical protein
MNKTALSIVISVILTIIIVSLVNVGASLFLNEPEYDDYCGNISIPKDVEEGTIAEGEYMKAMDDCRMEYENAMEPYNQKRFYIFALIGFVLLIYGLFVSELLLQITSLASGGILVFEGIVTNLENKLVVFVSLLAILVIFGILAYRIIKKRK